MIRPGAYRHFKKGTVYQVLMCGKDSENEEPVVIYNDPKGVTWVKPLSLFLSKPTVNGKEVTRYEYLERDW